MKEKYIWLAQKWLEHEDYRNSLGGGTHGDAGHDDYYGQALENLKKGLLEARSGLPKKPTG